MLRTWIPFITRKGRGIGGNPASRHYRCVVAAGNAREKILDIANRSNSTYIAFNGSQGGLGNFGIGTDVDAWQRMLLSHKNIRLIRIFLAVLVLTASSGATVVLHRCQMQGGSCCCPNRNANDACDQPVALAPGQSFRADFTCHANVVVGGVALIQALVERESKSESNVAVFPSIESLSSISLLQANSYSHNLLLINAVSPPSVDRYALIGSFLI
jgi:hypothetical protein